MEDFIRKMVNDTKRRREADAKRYAEQDTDLCMVCHAYGADKRSLHISCLYAVHEVVPEAIDLYDVPDKPNTYYLRICKACRGELLRHLQQWRDERAALRDEPKDHDGRVDDDDMGRCIPMRVNGATVLMTRDEYNRHTGRTSSNHQQRGSR